MSELEQIAASVAKTLGLRQYAPQGPGPAYAWAIFHNNGQVTVLDEKSVFDFEWQVRCRDWLLEHGHIVEFGASAHHLIEQTSAGRVEIQLICPASEFCARAIHALTTDKTSEGMR